MKNTVAFTDVTVNSGYTGIGGARQSLNVANNWDLRRCYVGMDQDLSEDSTDH